MTQDLHSPDNESLLEFPCDYHFKAMGKASDTFIDTCFEIALKIDAKATRESIKIKDSKGKNFISVTIPVYVTCLEQVHQIYADLKAHPEVLMTL
jgi:putative lipoic acid-binding regulatory protein